MPDLIINNLHVSVDGNMILKGVNLRIKKGEITALMGKNGSGKSTLAYTIMGHPKYKVEKGEIFFKGKNVLDMSPDERAKVGLFLSFQYPQEISGVSMRNFLRSSLQAVKNREISVVDFHKLMKEKMKLLNMGEIFADRYLNEGFSGGEKKRAEILQLAVLEPEMAILDETDSGLDIDALKTVANGINTVFNKNMGVFIITHYQRILDYVKPDKIYVMLDGRIVKEGGPELAHELESKGYEWIKAPEIVKESKVEIIEQEEEVRHPNVKSPEEITEKVNYNVIEVLKGVKDPELNIDIWALGLIYDVNAEGHNIDVKLTFTSPACPFGPEIVKAVKNGLKDKGYYDPKVEVIFNPPWQPSREVKAMLGLV